MNVFWRRIDTVIVYYDNKQNTICSEKYLQFSQ